MRSEEDADERAVGVSGQDEGFAKVVASVHAGLRALDASQNDVGKVSQAALPRLTKLTSLSLAENGLGGAEVEGLLGALAGCDELAALDLSSNVLETSVVASSLRCIQQHASLRFFNGMPVSRP